MTEQIFVEMYEHTKPECNNCRIPNSCCTVDACEMTEMFAKSQGVTLERTGEKLPFLGPNGCTVAPHLRPICTVHVCTIASLGFKPNDPEWTERYFKLREKIDDAIGE